MLLPPDLLPLGYYSASYVDHLLVLVAFPSKIGGRRYSRPASTTSVGPPGDQRGEHQHVARSKTWNLLLWLSQLPTSPCPGPRKGPARCMGPTKAGRRRRSFSASSAWGTRSLLTTSESPTAASLSTTAPVISEGQATVTSSSLTSIGTRKRAELLQDRGHFCDCILAVVRYHILNTTASM